MSGRNIILSEVRLGKVLSELNLASSVNLKTPVYSFLILFISAFFVSSVHAAPPAISIDNTSLAYTENDLATQIDSAAVLSDPDGDADWNGGTLVVQITANNEATDELSIQDNMVGTINTSGVSLLDGVTVIGTLSSSEGTVTNGTALTITFNSNATNVLVQQVLQSISYRNTSEAPGTLDRTITFTATDGILESASDGRTITVSTLNDAPTAIALSTNTIVQGSTGVGADIGNLSSTDIDSAAFTYSLVAEGTSDNGSCGVGNDIDNASFQITTASLQTAGVLTVGTYKVCIQTSDGAATFQQTFDVTVTINPADNDGSLTSATGVVEPVVLPWSVDTVGEAIDLFDFTLSDGGASDSLPMTVSQIIIEVGGSSNDTERNKVHWRLNGSDVNNVSGVYDDGSNTITFSGLNISIADGTSEVYTVNGYFNNTVGVRHNRTVTLEVNGISDVTVGSSGTSMGITSVVNNGTGTLLSDDVQPTVTSVTTPPANTYTAGDNLNFTVNFDEGITVSGAPRLTLTIGSATRFADYVSGSGSSALLFRYNIQAGEIDLDGISLGGAIDLNSATLRDSANNNIVTTLNNPGNLSSVLVESAAPVFQNGTPSVSATTLTQTTLSIRLNETGTVYYVLLPNGSGQPSPGQVKAGNNSSNGSAFRSDSINVSSANTNFPSNITGLTAGTAYDLYVVAEDGLGNLQTTVTKRDFSTDPQNSDGSLTGAATVIEPVALGWSVDTVGEAVNLFDFTLSDGGASDGLPMSVSQIIIRVSGSSTNAERAKVTWRLQGNDVNNTVGVYNAGSNTITFSGLNISIADGGSEIYTVNGYYNDNTGLTHNRTIVLRVDGDTDLTVGATGTLMGSTSIVTNGLGTQIRDDIQPTVSSVSVPANSTYAPGNNLDFTVNFNETVTVSGEPSLALTIGSTPRPAAYVSGSNSSSLLFRYAVQAGDQDSDGISIGTTVNGGTIQDSANNNAIRGLNNVGSLASVFVDAVASSLAEVTPVMSPTNDSTPSVTFSSAEAGTFTVGGVCGSTDEGSVPAGDTTITLTQANNVTPLASGNYSGCSITLTDGSNNVSNVTLSDFVIDLIQPSVVTNLSKSVGEGGTGNITTAELNSTDNVSTAVNLIYTITVAPSNGVLVKNGSMNAILVGGTFTQDEINNSLISYSNTNIGPTADTFTFNVTDQAGNISIASSFNFVIGNDLDGDGIGDNTDTDDDGDGIPDDWEIANGLDPRNASDATGDLDGDGKDNLTEFTEGTNPNTDDNPPVISLEDITLDATGLFTSVNVVVEGNVSANDFLDGPVSVGAPDLPNRFMPGVTVVTWTAIDAAGNEATREQKININPIVNFSVDQLVAEDSTSSFRVILNGEAVSYPVNVPYTIIGGTADSSDHNILANGTVTITSGNTEAEVPFTVSDAGGPIVENDENILLSLRALPSNVVRGSKSNLEISITENNIAPIVTLSATQAALITQLVTITGGNVVISSSVIDPNTADTHSYDWNATDNVLVDTDLDDSTFTFDPSGLATGTYTVRVSISDNNAISETSLMLTVLDTAPVLTTADSDGDIIDDQTEGFGDIDLDGIPDYLDNFDALNLLPSIASSDMAETFPLETEAGLKLVLGTTAFQVGKGQAGISMVDITQAGLLADAAEFNYSSGIFDFEVVGIGAAGKSVKVVLPQQQAIPANAIYRKLVNGVWQEYVIDANNSLASAQGAPGVCPPPGSILYQNGLFEGHHCVQLTIEDGGANDSDGTANNRIADPGGVTAALIEPPAPAPKSDNSNGIFGLGSVSIWWLSMFALFGLRHYGIRTV